MDVSVRGLDGLCLRRWGSAWICAPSAESSARFRRAHFLNRVFTEAERAYLKAGGRGVGERRGHRSSRRRRPSPSAGHGLRAGNHARSRSEVTHADSGAAFARG